MVAINPKEIVNQLSAIAERYLKNPTELKKILDVATKTAASSDVVKYRQWKEEQIALSKEITYNDGACFTRYLPDRNTAAQ